MRCCHCKPILDEYLSSYSKASMVASVVLFPFFEERTKLCKKLLKLLLGKYYANISFASGHSFARKSYLVTDALKIFLVASVIAMLVW